MEAASLLRNTQQHHVALSGLADQKAGFLIGGSIVLLGLVIGQLGGEYSWGLLAAGFTALMTLSLSIWAVMPRFGAKPPEADDSINTLFFGAFAHMHEHDFIDRHMELLDDPEQIRRAMLRDIHQMGTALNNTKFRFLGYAFRVAFIGYALSFGVALFEFLSTR